jgi:ParB family chromosome partitioning protein
MTERKVLGRGLSSLIPNLPPPIAEVTPISASAGAGTALEVPTHDIAVNPQQPRRKFSEATLEELTQSIRRCGVLQPLIVRKSDRGFELIAGERRLRAAKRAGLATVPVVIRPSNDRDQLEVALIENLQREDLTPMEEAKGYERLSEEFGMTHEEIAKRVGRERSTITNMLRLLELAAPVQEMLNGGAITMGHARALLPITDARRQEELAHWIEKEGLSVRQVEILVRKMTGARERPRRVSDLSQNPNLRSLADDLQRKLGTRIEIIQRGKGGEVRIQYYNPEDLRRLADQLLAGA